MYRNNDPKQPDSLEEILKLRPEGADVAPTPVDDLRGRMKAAVLGRYAGCTLGVPVEGWKVASMQAHALDCGMDFPPTNYWKEVTRPNDVQYGISKRSEYSLAGIDKVPVDDDITYAILNMLLLEKYGKNYTVQDVGEFWLEVLPYACTAEDEALQQLRAGTRAECAANFNSYVEWIGAAIRADAFGYAEAGNPVAAAKLSYPDAYLTHRKNGIYGEMFAAASIAAAFTAKTPLDAVKEGMKQIPAESDLYKDLEWALSYEGKITNYLRARALLDERFEKMHPVHTNNNMCAVVFGLMLGGDDFTSCISNTVGIGLDNDCTGATVGSIAGACLGLDAIPEYWYKNFNDTVCTYITGYPTLSIEDVVDRLVKLNG
ncbi:MAG: ADP-ribosylglycohydrolase family protein [Lachnospiraceae bacterium]|nr:ADP-ribosylglycohydrolase family protein [Lachnospiraceae bacterium]